MKILTAICAMCILLMPSAMAQTSDTSAKVSDTDIQLLRSDVQAEKNQLIAHNMQFTEAESTAFWPLYRDYARDQQIIGDSRVQLIKDYGQNFDSMDDAKAKDMTQRMMGIEEKNLKLRQDYWPKFEKALGAKRAAKFYQVDGRISLLIKVQLASYIPLVP